MKFERWLIDSDSATCMCKFGFVDDLTKALGVPLQALCILPQLRYQLNLAKPAKALEKLGSIEAVEQAQWLTAHATEVIVLADSANQALLEATPDIDGGELALFAALLDSTDSGLITGDKRALIALSKVEGAIADGLVWVRILCTEEAIALLIKHLGHAYVSGKVRACPEANVGLSIVFGRTAPNSEESTSVALKSYIKELVANTGGKYTPQYVATTSSLP